MATKENTTSNQDKPASTEKAVASEKAITQSVSSGTDKKYGVDRAMQIFKISDRDKKYFKWHFENDMMDDSKWDSVFKTSGVAYCPLKSK